MNNSVDENIVDLKVLMISADNDKLWAAELFQLFLQDTGSRIEAIEKAMNSGEYKDLTIHIHTIKGSAGSIGAKKMKQCAFEMEVISREGQFDALKKKVPELKEEFDKVMMFFKENFDKVIQ